ncbi:hypothetical protein [Pseudomonas sp. NPDC089396]|uniref:hypothetical protein n=1 Tax=Pseudomonas sp. NPDC089396 TaxID=3364461 RepID=UPI00383965A5
MRFIHRHQGLIFLASFLAVVALQSCATLYPDHHTAFTFASYGAALGCFLAAVSSAFDHE